MGNRTDIANVCKEKLIEFKMDLLNRLIDLKRSFLQNSEDKGGDEADQTLRILTEKQNLTNHHRILEMLTDIEVALRKIETKTFGVCEETDELIEEARLLALPWTRFSIEGAEIRESKKNQFRKQI